MRNGKIFNYTDILIEDFVYGTGGCGKGIACILTLGDINNDGAVNGKDSNVMKQILSGATMPTETEEKAADVTKDGNLNGNDANILSRFLAGAIGSLE